MHDRVEDMTESKSQPQPSTSKAEEILNTNIEDLPTDSLRNNRVEKFTPIKPEVQHGAGLPTKPNPVEEFLKNNNPESKPE